MNSEANDRRPEITYPCEWSYKIIGTDIQQILDAIEEAAGDLSYDVTPSNISKHGKYFSLNLKLTVPNETVRDIIYENLNKNEFIKFVI